MLKENSEKINIIRNTLIGGRGRSKKLGLIMCIYYKSFKLEYYRYYYYYLFIFHIFRDIFSLSFFNTFCSRTCNNYLKI